MGTLDTNTTISKFKLATMDIKSAYLNAPLPNEADWITTTLEPHIAEVCGLDPAQEYRIANALYGLPDSGRIFYLHYKAALTAEGYTMSQFDNCLFYKISAAETTYIIVYVDDTFIFSNTDANIESVITSIGKHYEVTLKQLPRTPAAELYPGSCPWTTTELQSILRSG